ncbi:TonB-dependent receptor plug domain-containing protein [Brevundimonas sp. R86498]|uniref:TonB-dependent receptor plug domain-containing protein n=1 Tax=Brevundimonas sp. R86498 TaxID=3093845 RepID=UPI0037CC7CDD
MTSRQTKQRLRASTILIGASLMTLGAFPAFAQDSDREAAAVDDIVVTGSRIRQPGFEASSPVTSVGAEEIALDQPFSVEELIKDLPVAIPAIGPGVNNGSGGGATINLRGLGTNRTLVLVNGRRVVPFNLAGVVDTNSIPVALIERVDLVTGGASAVYGADAVAGVVNFILKDDFEGVEFQSSWGISEFGDAERRRNDLTVGGNFADGRGNAFGSIGWTENGRLNQDQRPYGGVAIGAINGLPQGSGTTVPAFFRTTTVSGGTPLPSGTGVGQGSAEINPATGALVPANAGGFNFNPDNLYQTPLDRYQLNAGATYEVNPMFEAYLDLMYVRSDVATDAASTGTFGNTFQVPIGNPLIPEPMRQQLCAARAIAAADCVSGAAGTTMVPLLVNRRITELGPRFTVNENKTFQFTAGFRGDLSETWNYDVYMSRGETDQVTIRDNWGSLSKVRNALNTVSATSCLAPGSTTAIAGCVPLNVFGAEGSITQAMADYINLDSINLTSVDQEVYSGSVSGSLPEQFNSPFAADPISLAFGLEYRASRAQTRSDGPSQIQGEVLGTGAPFPDRQGRFELTEGYVEALIPLLSDLPFIQSLNLEAGYRYSEFETAGKVTDYGSYKIGGDWVPFDGLRFRTMFQRAVRAPNIGELFAPQVTGLGNLAADPCQGALINSAQANTPGTLSNLCVLTGVPTGNVGTVPVPSAGQINILTGGNPDLQPEEADTFTVGAVWQPSFINNLTLTLDYYDIQIDGAVSSQSSTDVLNGCYTTAFNPNFEFNAQCALIGRNPNNGTLNGVESPGIALVSSNLGKERASGYDFTAAYLMDLVDFGLSDRWGTLNLSFSANYVTANEFQATPTSINRDCIGFYSVACVQPNFELKTSSRATWNLGDFGFSVQWRHQDEVIEEPGGTVFPEAAASIDAYNYFDLTGRWDLNDAVRLTVTVSNLTDEQPPILGSGVGTTAFNNGNTFPQTYDTLGRYYTGGITLRF